MNEDKRFLEELEPVSNAGIGGDSGAMAALSPGSMAARDLAEMFASAEAFDSVEAFDPMVPFDPSEADPVPFDSAEAPHWAKPAESAKAFGSRGASLDSMEPSESEQSLGSGEARDQLCGCADIRFLDELSAPEVASGPILDAAQIFAPELFPVVAQDPSPGTDVDPGAMDPETPMNPAAPMDPTTTVHPRGMDPGPMNPAAPTNPEIAVDPGAMAPETPMAPKASASPAPLMAGDPESPVAPSIQSAYDVARASGIPLRLILVMNRVQDAAPRDYLLPEVPRDWRVATVLTHERLRDACHRWGVSTALLARINLMNPAGYVYPGQRFLLPG